MIIHLNCRSLFHTSSTFSSSFSLTHCSNNKASPPMINVKYIKLLKNDRVTLDNRSLPKFLQLLLRSPQRHFLVFSGADETLIINQLTGDVLQGLFPSLRSSHLLHGINRPSVASEIVKYAPSSSPPPCQLFQSLTRSRVTRKCPTEVRQSGFNVLYTCLTNH